VCNLVEGFWRCAAYAECTSRMTAVSSSPPLYLRVCACIDRRNMSMPRPKRERARKKRARARITLAEVWCSTSARVCPREARGVGTEIGHLIRGRGRQIQKEQLPAIASTPVVLSMVKWGLWGIKPSVSNHQYEAHEFIQMHICPGFVHNRCTRTTPTPFRTKR